jgi:hydrogenase-4 component E
VEWGADVSEALNLLVGVAMGMNLVALGSSRLPSLIRVAALQGMVLGIMPLVMEHEMHVMVAVVAVATVVMKGLVIPSLLRRAMRTANIDRDMFPLIGFLPSLLLGAAGTIGAVVLARRLPLLPEHRETLLVAGALASVFTGLLLLIGRAKAISQVCGYLVLENGIYLFGLLLLHSTPLLVEGGILLDLTVAVFVIGIIVDRIQRAFDTLDTRKLTVLRE